MVYDNIIQKNTRLLVQQLAGGVLLAAWACQCTEPRVHQDSSPVCTSVFWLQVGAFHHRLACVANITHCWRWCAGPWVTEEAVALDGSTASAPSAPGPAAAAAAAAADAASTRPLHGCTNQVYWWGGGNTNQVCWWGSAALGITTSPWASSCPTCLYLQPQYKPNRAQQPRESDPSRLLISRWATRCNHRGKMHSCALRPCSKHTSQKQACDQRSSCMLGQVTRTSRCQRTGR
jgi:hypothetical protein